MKWARCQKKISAGDTKIYKYFIGQKAEGKDHFEDLDADGKLILQ